MWHIIVVSFNGSSTLVGGGGDVYVVGADIFANSPNTDRTFIRWGWNKTTQKITIQPFVSSQGSTVFAPFDVYTPTQTDIICLACKIYNRTDGQTGTAIDYITPASPNQITTINYSLNIIRPNILSQPLRGNFFTNSFLSPFVIHEVSYNDATDSNILSKMAYLRNKWSSI